MMNLFEPPKYAELDLVGVDGNAFSIMGAFRRAARKSGWSSEDIEKVISEAESSDYRHLLYVIQSHCRR